LHNSDRDNEAWGEFLVFSLQLSDMQCFFDAAAISEWIGGHAVLPMV
jgi:hypothetical protein